MDTTERAQELAGSIIATAAKAGLQTHAVITDMNEVLGTTAGNALEIEESILYLRNERRDPRLDDVTLSLCAEMLVVGGVESDRQTARTRCEEAVTSGRAAEVFSRMVHALGGPPDFVDHHSKHLAKAPVVRAIPAEGCVTRVNTRAVGNAIIELGGGRRKVGETLNLSVGFSEIAPVGTMLNDDTPLAVVHAASESDADKAQENLLAAYELGESASPGGPVVSEILTG
jgi:thymidine phosphorylase